MKNIYLLFSHKLTNEQLEDLQSLGIDSAESIKYLPQDLQTLWSNIPSDAESLNDILTPLKKHLLDKAQEGDLVLVQGDFGATYSMIRFCYMNYLTPIYATSSRISKETIKTDGTIEKVAIFKHQRFRIYED